MTLNSVSGVSPVRHLVAAAPADSAAAPATAPAIVAKATEGDDGLPKEGLAKWALDKVMKVGGDIKKLPTWQKVVISVVGFFAGWKLNDWVHKMNERKEGETYDKYGQDAYLALKGNTPELVKALKEEHTFGHNLTNWDVLEKKWNAFNTYAVLMESQNPTLGTIGAKDNLPVALIALSGNKTASKDAMRMLAIDVARRVNGAPAKQAFYADVIKNLKDVHDITVNLQQV